MAAPLRSGAGRRRRRRGKRRSLGSGAVRPVTPRCCRCRAAPGPRLLQPYPPGRHGPRHHHRDVRDCQPLQHGNVTHEAWPGDGSTGLPLATTRTFVSYVPSVGDGRRVVYGHFTFVRNPRRTLSVLEPGGAGGCRARRRAPVEETARLGKCLVAQNGGYFDMETGECLGNVVSDGRLVRNARGLQNAQFGIRKDGTMVFG